MRTSFVAFCCIFLYPLYVISFSPSLNDDVLGLIVFKADVKDPDGKLISWNEDDNTPCNWFGVKCNPRSGRVSDVVLDGYRLSGKIGRGLLQLQFLRKLSLAGNNFTGKIGLSVAQLPELRVLDLSRNDLSGPISADFFGQCGSLRSLSLAHNKISGLIPESVSFCSVLASFNLRGNQLSGPLPSGLWLLPALRSLDLSDNMFEAEIPSGIEGLYNLRALNLSKNHFVGRIPDGIGSCLLLRSIDLSGNSLSGLLPSTMQKLTLCSILVLRENNFSGEVPFWIGELRSLVVVDLSENSFSGRIPDSIEKLQSLKTLNLSTNSLFGTLPETMRSCVSLLSLDISHNLLSANLPSWIFNLGLQKIIFSNNIFIGSLDNLIDSSAENSLKKLLVLDLSQNKLSGEIPIAVGIFKSLQSLKMAKNLFVGSIPASIAQLKALTVFDMSDNRLNGIIPSEIGGATSLNELILEKNSFGGIIPSSIGNCSSLRILSLAHNDITGPVPASLAQLSYLETVDFSSNKLTGTLPKQLANLGHLKVFNVSQNQIQGELPTGGFFNTMPSSSVSGNPSLCGAAVNRSCSAVLPKPLVLNPNSTDDIIPGTIPQNFAHGKKILSISALIAISAAAAIVIGVIAITVLNLRVRSPASSSAVALTFSGGDDLSGSPEINENSGKLVMFSGDADFSPGRYALLNKSCELGRGGFGAVYRTRLKDGRSVAIKKLAVSSLVKSQEDFEGVIRKLGKIRHNNLVTLDGYYWTPTLQLLIYEFVPGGNLYKHLLEGRDGKYLSWDERFDVILGAAKGLAHLHQAKIIHYNLKSSNILINASGEPKVADYGLARLLPMLDRYVLSSKIQSALGYMAPEFACKTVKITEKCDVYGFGVLIMEIVTGRRPVEYMYDDVVVLCDLVRGALEEGKVEECADDRLEGTFPAEEVIAVMKLGLICTSQVPSNRPDMAEVVNILELIRSPLGNHDELRECH